MRLHEFFDYHARERPQNEFAVHGPRTFTYRQAASEINRLAHSFQKAGLKKGDRIVLLSKNSIEYVFLFLAASKVGVVPVPLNYRLAPLEWEYIINDARARLVVASSEYALQIDGIRERLTTTDRFVVTDSSARPGWDRYCDWISGQPEFPPPCPVGEQDDLYQMYTSGTTGRPKGAALTQGSVSANVFQMLVTLRREPGDRCLIVAPLYHAAGAITAFNCISWGGSLVIHEAFDPHRVVKALSEDGICGALLIPAMIQACLVEVPDIAERDFSSLKVILYGGSPIAEETLLRAASIFGCDFFQGYGMTEATAVVTCLDFADHRRAVTDRPELIQSAGRPLVGTEIAIADAEGNLLPAGAIGEILVRGPQLMRSYWNHPEETERALAGGWLHTGDAGKLDEDGYLYILDRIKDLVVSGGENVYPRAVEDVLFEHPAIADAAVIGIPDQLWGEAVKAVVVVREGHRISENELVEFCRTRLGGFEIPRSVDFIDKLPRNPSGKVLKRELREPYWEGHRRRV